MRLDLELVFVVAIIAIYGVALFMAKGWPLQTALFPVLVSGVGLSLAITLLITRVARDKEGRDSELREVQRTNKKKVLSGFMWILVFFGTTSFLGFQWGLPGVILVYLKFDGKEKMALSTFLAAICWFIIYSLKAFLHLPLYSGHLAKWL